MLVLMAIGWCLFIGVPECVLARRQLSSDGVLDCGALMLENADLPCRGDLFKSGVVVSGEV